LKKKDIVVGLGEIGSPILRLVSKGITAVGYDKNPKIMNRKKFDRFSEYSVELLHVCIPFSKDFEKKFLGIVKKYNPQGVVIHSTISPSTTLNLQKKSKIPIVYSATRGVHKRMIKDLHRYTKFYSVYSWAPNARWVGRIFSKRMEDGGVKVKKMSNPLTLELAKIIVDTSYYGWLINYAQLSNMIAIKHKVDYDEMWSFAEEIHKILGNRPKMFPGFIGGHCVIPNLDLISDKTLNIIKEINSDYSKIQSKRRKKGKKY